MAKAPKKNLDEIIKETDSQKKVDEICHKAEREIEEVLSSHSQEDINGIRKQLEGCTNRPYPFPTGEISFKGINISLDSIYGQYNIFRKNFEDAKKYNDEQNLPDLANVFRIHAENKLIDFILFLVDKVHDTEGELLINWEEKKLEEFDIEEFKSKLCSRDEVAEQIYKIRWKSISLKWLIQLRDWINIDLSDDKFSSIIREYQQEYDNAKNNNEKAKLDTRLAELLILESWYIIQINNQLLPTRNSNYKKDWELHQNLKICKEWLEKIWISTDAIKFTHNWEKFYAIKKVEKNINKKSKEKKETLWKPTINDIYTDSSKWKEMMKKLIESGTLLVDFWNWNGFEEVSDFNPDMRELRKNTKFKDEDGNIYILDIWDKDTRGKTVRWPFETEPDDYYYHFRKTGTKPETQTETETQIETETQPETQTETETPIPPIIITETETETEIETETETETETEIETETETETETEIDLPTSFEENVVLSDVSESYEDMISREVENEINEEWHNTSRYNVLKRGKLFLMRWRVRRKKINEKKKNYERTPFTNNAIFNKEMGTQASRHDLEEILQWKWLTRNAFWNIQRQTMIESNEWDELHETERWKEFKELCQGYISWAISLIDFKKRFNEFVRVRLGLPEEQQFVATNVLEKLNAIKNDNELFGAIKSDLEKYLTDHNNSHFDSIRRQIDANFKKYRKDPRFRKEIMDIMWNPSKLDEAMLDKEIQKFIRHQAALAKLSTENLQIKLDLLRNGKWAYQTSNKDREKWWLFKLWNKLDKMPWWWQALTIAGISVSWMAVWLLWWWALAATLTTSWLIWAKAAVKKFTHHTKEQNTYEKNLTRNYEEEIAKMKEWERIMAEKDSEWKYTNSWFKRYRAKRQLELYGKTTQAELQRDDDFNTKQLSDLIYSGLEHYDTLSPNEKNVLNTNLLDARARLEAYWSMGHNFLRSKDRNQIERDFYDLENALNLSAIHIIGPSATLQDIPAEIEAYYDWKQINYDDLLKEYRKDYNSATKKFRWERAWLATKWWLWTAAISFGTAAAMQAATGTWMFAKEAVPWTPGTPETTSTTNTWNVTDHYGLSQREWWNNILNAAENNISGDTSSVTLHFYVFELVSLMHIKTKWIVS